MSSLPGILNISDTERAFINNVGQQVVFDAVNQVMADYNTELTQATAVFVDRETEKFKMRWLLPGAGRLQRLSPSGGAAAAAVKRYGYYDVAFPLRGWGDQIAGHRVGLAYMTIAELDAHLDTIMIQDLNTMRWRILLSLFEDDNLTFVDPIHGNLTITRLANTDGTAYPPVLGSETEADDHHYLGADYLVTAIADANNPVVTCRDEIAEHFGGIGSAGRRFIYFHGADQTAYLAGITGYTAVSDQYIAIGANTADTLGLPTNVPGRIHGRLSGAWLSEWDGWIPDTYGLMILTEVGAPLLKRVDPADTGLPRGLSLVSDDEKYPFIGSHYVHRYGFGCANRLSACVIRIYDGTYISPSSYSEP